MNDHLGTPQQLITATGLVVWQAAYLPYGEAQVRINLVENNLRFPGQYFDAESGLHYNWNRYYDAQTGRYISADPIGLEGGMNVYAYVNGNPVNGMDLEGLTIYIGGGGGATLHVGPSGVTGHLGIVIGTDGQICIYATGCFRVGPGVYAGGGYEFIVGGGTCETTKEQIEGMTYGFGFDTGLLKPGVGGGVTGNKNGIGGMRGRGGGGLGLSGGVDICKTKALFCFSLI